MEKRMTDERMTDEELKEIQERATWRADLKLFSDRARLLVEIAALRADVALERERVRLVAQPLGRIAVAAGVANGRPMTGPELLLIAEDVERQVTANASIVAAARAWAECPGPTEESRLRYLVKK